MRLVGSPRAPRRRGAAVVSAVAWSVPLVVPAVLPGALLPGAFNVAATASTSSVSPAELVQLAAQAVLHQQSVGWQYTSCTARALGSCAYGETRLDVYTGPGAATASLLETSSATAGPKAAPLRVSFLFSGPRLYMNGNASGLYDNGGLTRVAAVAEAGRWLGTPASSPAFRQVALSLQVSAISGELQTVAAADSFLAPLRLRGELVRRVKESGAQNGHPVSEVVWIGPTDLPLRVSSQSSFVALGKEWWTSSVYAYSTWGRTVPVGVPAHWVPLQTGWLSVAPGTSAMPGPGGAAGLP